MYKLIWLVLIVSLVLLLALPINTESKALVVVIEEVTVKLPIQEYAKLEVEKAFGVGQWEYFNYIVSKESHQWTVYTAHYPSGYTRSGVKSSAYGLCGFLNATWKGVKTDNPYIQIDECIVYVKERYGTPYRAKIHHNKNNWF